MTNSAQLLNYINGQWQTSRAKDVLDVRNPATDETLARVPLSPKDEVDRAAQHAAEAYIKWRQVPAGERVQYLFKLKNLLEEHFDDIAKTITQECGKTLAESRGELRRGVENVETACGIPLMMQGYNSEDIAHGIDETMIRQPVGVVAAITPFNFPAMIPLWFMPYALACGNCFILKPSERVPLTMQKLFGLLEQTGFPKGVVQLLNGGKEAVDAILTHPTVRAVSFVGSTAVAKYVYSQATANGKRAQCQGGAKNPIVVLPDADMEATQAIVADSAFGCAGQRCLAASVAITVGQAREPFTEVMVDAATSRSVGYGLDEGVQMGPVITSESKTRIEGLIQQGADEGAKVVVDGRKFQVSGHERGHFVGPTVLQGVQPESEIAKTEIFGPVLSLIHVDDLDEALTLINRNRYGNMACLFTRSGSAARKFRYEAKAGNIGINLGVAAPMAFFPFTGWNDSFFGDLHAQGWDAIEFYTEKKVVIERWPDAWTRKF